MIIAACLYYQTSHSGQYLKSKHWFWGEIRALLIRRYFEVFFQKKSVKFNVDVLDMQKFV